MSSSNPFTPLGNTAAFVAAASAPTAVQVVANTIGSTQYLIQNSGNVVVFVGTGPSATAAAANAVTVTASNSTIVLLPYTSQVYTMQSNNYFTGVASANASVYITPGEGN